MPINYDNFSGGNSGGGGGGGITSINGSTAASQTIAGTSGGVSVSSSGGTTTLNTTSANTQITSLTGGNTTPVINVGTQTLEDTSGEQSLGWNDRLLYTPTEAAIDYGSQHLLKSGAISIDWGSYVAYGSNTEPAIDWENKILNDNQSSGGQVTSINWNTRELFNSISQPVVNWNDQTLLDTNAQLSLHWNNRTLNSALGTTVLDWSVFHLYDNSSVLAMDWSARTMNDSSGNAVFTTAPGYLSLGSYQIGIEAGAWLLSFPSSTPAVGYMYWDGSGNVSTGSFTGDSLSVAYNPGNSSNWNGNPSSLQDAIDRLAAAVEGLLSAPIP